MADSTKIKPPHWKLIVERIYERRCVPFLGAGVNVSSGEYRGLPLAGEVSMRLIETLTGKRVKNLDELVQVNTDESLNEYKELTRTGLHDLARVALHVEFINDTPYLMKRLNDILSDDDREPSKLLNTLAQMPFELIVTTNYDQLMERALPVKPKVVVQPINGFDADTENALRDELAAYKGTVVYKIHGTFKNEGQRNHDGSSPVIITEEDYIKFLTSIGKSHGGIPVQIKSKLTYSTLLFLGYSLQDWDFRTIFKGLIESLEPHEKRKSFAIQKDPSEFWVDFWVDKGVQIYNVDLYEFAEQLEEKYKAYRTQQDAKK